MTKIFLIATAMLSVVTSPAMAREARPTAAVQGDDASARPAAKPVEQRYCVHETETGSSFVYRRCLTRSQWLRDGFDPIVPIDSTVKQ